MKVLIIGMGYAGRRYLRAWKNVARQKQIPLEVAYYSRRNKNNSVKYYDCFATALTDFCPDVLVIAVTDGWHYEVIEQLIEYKGFVICEKPFIGHEDSLVDAGAKLVQCSGFCLDMVERYSAVSSLLRNYISEYNLEPIRCTFHWGNDRLWDCRPTSGVSSEIIHPIDLVQWICKRRLVLDKVIALESDFAVGSAFKLDSAFILAQLGAEAVCMGYSSFVNVITKRTLSFIFRGGEGGIVFARVVYDDPDWDHDYIKIWEKDKECAPLLEERVVGTASGAADHQIIKLMRQVEDVVNFVYSGKKPAVEFADLNAAIDLQKMLNDINSYSGRYRAPIFSVKGQKRVIDYHNS